MTDVELPAGWRRLKLGDLERDGLLELRAGFAQGVHNEDGRGVPHLRPFNVTDDGRVDFDKIKFVEPPPDASPQWLRTGDVIFNNTNSEALAGKTALFDSDLRCVPSNHMTVLRATSEQSPDPYWLAAQLRYLWGIGVFRTLLRRYVGQATVSLTRLRDLVLSAPPLEEQRAIAHVLRTVQQAKEATEQVIAAAQELKKSLMRHLFHSAGREAWPERTLSDVAVGGPEGIQGGPFGSKLVQKDYVDSGVPVIRGVNLPLGRRFSTQELVFVSDEKARELARHTAKPGDLIVTQRGTLGQVGIVPDAPYELYVVSQSQMKATIDPSQASVDFVFYYLQTSEALNRLLDSKVQTGVPHINLGSFRALRMPVPDLDVQRDIVRALEAADVKLSAELARRDALASLFDSLLNDLMTARLRVGGLELTA